MDLGNSPAGQWLGLSALTAKGLHSIPGQGYKILQAKECGQKKKGLVQRGQAYCHCQAAKNWKGQFVTPNSPGTTGHESITSSTDPGTPEI